MRTTPTLSVPALLLVLAGCNGESSAAENPQSPSLTQKARDAALKARDEAGAMLAEWKESAERSLASQDARLEELKQKASTLAGKEKERLDAAITELEPKRKELAARLSELGKQGEEAWKKAKPELDRLAAELKRLVDEQMK